MLAIAGKGFASQHHTLAELFEKQLAEQGLMKLFKEVEMPLVPVLLAMAITPVPNLLLLDEPVSGVDLSGIELFYQMVSQLRRDYHLSIILVSHDLATVAQFADRIVFLNRTVIADGTPREVLSNRAVRQAFALPPEMALSFPEIGPEHTNGRGCISCNLEKSP